MSATAVFGDELDALGVWWPRGDGDALRATAQVWTAIADQLEEAADVLDVAASAVTDGHRGEASRRFAEAWAAWSGPDGHLRATVADCRRLAASLDDFGTDVDVADRTLYALAEQALDELLRALSPEAVAAWTEWLHEHAGAARSTLDAGATRCAGALDGCRERRPTDPAHPVPVVLDPDRIEWVDPGTPVDRRGVADEVIDLGLTPDPPVTPPTAPVPGPTVPAPLVGDGSLPRIDTAPGGVTIVVTGNSGPVTIDVDAAPTASSWAPTAATALPPPVPDAVPSLASFSSRGGGPASSWTPPPLEPLPPLEPVAPVTPTVPVTIERPPVSPVEAVAGVGATAAVAAAAGKKASQGFVPFMPMGGGGGGGDDGPEPRRRARRPAPT